MRIRTIFVLAAVFLSVAAQSRVAWAESRPMITLSETWMEKYIIRVGGEVYGKPVFQTEFNISFPNGLSIDLFGSTGLNTRQNFDKEVDINVDWTNQNFSLGASYSKLAPLQKLSSGLFDIYAEAHHTFTLGNNSITPYFRADGMIATKDPSANSGFIGAIGARHLWTINDPLSIVQSIETLYHTPIFQGPAGFGAQYNFALNVKLSDHITLSPLFKVATPTNGKFNKALGLRLTYTFP